MTGGVTGIAAIVFYATGLHISLTYFVINFVLLIAALKILGLKFMIKTVYAIFMLSFFLYVAQNVMTSSDGQLIRVLEGVKQESEGYEKVIVNLVPHSFVF